MPASEQDLELLECFLDGDLDSDQTTLLQGRLASEPELSGALESLRAQRRIRRDLWASLEPDEAAASAFAGRVCSSIARRGRFAAALRSLRYVAAAAACIAIGFLLRPAFDHRPPNQTTLNNGVNVQPVSSYEVTLRDQSGRIVAVQRFDTMEKAQEFAADLARWQARQERLASGHFVIKADRF